MEPWFIGQDGVGLSLTQGKALLGARLHLTPSRNAETVRHLVPPARKALATVGQLLKMAVAPGQRGPLSHGYYMGVRGLGLVFSRPDGTRHLIPIALYNPRGFILLTEAESRRTVQRGALDAAAMRRLTGGMSALQLQAPRPATTSTTRVSPGALLAGLLGTAAVLGAGAYTLTR